MACGGDEEAMIVGIGVDVVAVARVAGLLERHGERFLRRCLHPDEGRRPADPEHLAGILAAKEATFKALGTGWGEGVGWRSVKVARDAAGAPRLVLRGAAAARAAALAVERTHLSISHTAGVAVAVVVLEG